MELLLPSACARCGRAASPPAVLCVPCDGALPRLPDGLCVLCQATPVPGVVGRCAGCRLAASSLSACLAGAPYAGEVAGVVQRFKYPRPGILGLDPSPRAVLGQLVVEAAARAPGRAELVVPVPLHRARLRERGFNPAVLLARTLAKTRGLRLDAVALERVRDTPSQTGLDGRARRRNVAGAFRARRPPPRRVWLIDDVVTTGATLEAAARALRRAGAEEVTALCAARTPSPG